MPEWLRGMIRIGCELRLPLSKSSFGFGRQGSNPCRTYVFGVLRDRECMLFDREEARNDGEKM